MKSLGWFGIVRLGLVQSAIGAVVVLATSVINRVMVVELALPALLPGCLVALHYAIQLLRPRLGYGSDRGGHATRWMVGGMALLAVGGIGAAVATAVMATHLLMGVLLAILSFVAIGLGVGAAGTTLLVFLAKRAPPERRAVAATVVWLMMIAGFVVTTVCAGRALEPFSAARLIEVTSVVAGLAFVVTLCATWRLDNQSGEAAPATGNNPMPSFRIALAEVWRESAARQLTIFIFLSMLAYSAEELILDPFAGTVFNYSPGQSTELSGALHGGVFLGMLFVAVSSSISGIARVVSMRRWMIAGCVLSALALASVACAGVAGGSWPLRQNIFMLGVANGVFAVSAIGSMMTLAGEGSATREGVRMGLWGAAQGIAFGLGGIFASATSDIARALIAAPGTAYAVVFGIECLLFAMSAVVAHGMRERPGARRSSAIAFAPRWETT